MHIFERAAFDSALAAAALAQGLQLHSNERLLDLRMVEGGIEVVTNADTYQAKVLVAADGANSTVRRKLGVAHTPGIAPLLRVMTPLDTQQDSSWQQRSVEFDFSCIRQGIQGYSWDFPCYLDGQAYMNRGIFDSRLIPDLMDRHERANLKHVFAAGLRARHVDAEHVIVEGHPVRWFNPNAEFARPHVLLVGDAAGVDPLFAEGISYAMEYGIIAAETISDAVRRDDYSFTTYRTRLLDHKLGRSLKRRAATATMLYRHRVPPLWSLLWQMAAVSPQATRRAVGAMLDVLPS
jgi:flavin-dependent dehydrogenase